MDLPPPVKGRARLMPEKSSRYIGVVIVNGKFISKIAKDGKHYYLGSHDTQESAAESYDKMCLYLYDEKKKTNFPDKEWSAEEINLEYERYLERIEKNKNRGIVNNKQDKQNVREILVEVLDNQQKIMRFLGIDIKREISLTKGSG